jgi:hypothetical protein
MISRFVTATPSIPRTTVSVPDLLVDTGAASTVIRSVKRTLYGFSRIAIRPFQ